MPDVNEKEGYLLMKKNQEARATNADDALVSLDHIKWSIENFNADNSSFPHHRDVTLADLTVEFTRIANGGRDSRPINEQAAEIAQGIMAEFINALEAAQEEAA